MMMSFFNLGVKEIKRKQVTPVKNSRKIYILLLNPKSNVGRILHSEAFFMEDS